MSKEREQKLLRFATLEIVLEKFRVFFFSKLNVQGKNNTAATRYHSYKVSLLLCEIAALCRQAGRQAVSQIFTCDLGDYAHKCRGAPRFRVGTRLLLVSTRDTSAAV